MIFGSTIIRKKTIFNKRSFYLSKSIPHKGAAGFSKDEFLWLIVGTMPFPLINTLFKIKKTNNKINDNASYRISKFACFLKSPIVDLKMINDL